MFRGYDVRGAFPGEVSEEKFEALGRAMNSFSRELICGLDYRKHEKTLFDSFCRGYSGKVILIGNCPTAAVSFNSVGRGIAFTASHNPASHAGAKFIRERHTVSEKELAEIKKEHEKALLAESTASASVVQAPELLEKYVDSIPEMGGALFDLSGGAACAVKELFEKRIFDSPDPMFERHSPEPKRETLGELARRTRDSRKLGLAFDGDADRCMAVDCGELIDGGIATAFLCTQHFSKNDAIVVNIDFTDEVKDYLRDEGFKTTVCPVGTTHVVESVLANNALLGAERNGHYYFPRHLPDSDGIYAAALLSQARPGELLEFSRQFTHVLLAEAVETSVDFEKLRRLVAEDDAVLEHNFMDGVYARFEDYTLLVRASQTEAKIRINSEAETREKARDGVEKAKAYVSKAKT